MSLDIARIAVLVPVADNEVGGGGASSMAIFCNTERMLVVRMRAARFPELRVFASRSNMTTPANRVRGVRTARNKAARLSASEACRCARLLAALRVTRVVSTTPLFIGSESAFAQPLNIALGVEDGDRIQTQRGQQRYQLRAERGGSLPRRLGRARSGVSFGIRQIALPKWLPLGWQPVGGDTVIVLAFCDVNPCGARSTRPARCHNASLWLSQAGSRVCRPPRRYGAGSNMPR